MTDVPFLRELNEDDYRALHAIVRRVDGEEGTAKDYQENVAICGFCGATAQLDRWEDYKVQLAHRAGCLVLEARRLLGVLPEPNQDAD